MARGEGSSGSSVPPVVLDHVGQLDDEFALLVLLTAFEGMLLMERRRGRERGKTETVKRTSVCVVTSKSRSADPKIMDSCWGDFLDMSIKLNTFK